MREAQLILWEAVLVLAIVAIVVLAAYAIQIDTGYNNRYKATVHSPKGIFVCDTVAIWEGRDEIEVKDCTDVGGR
jgi:hypothetical protein